MDFPTPAEFSTLRHVPGKISLATHLIAFASFAERINFFGTGVVFRNYIQRPLPPGSTTGAGAQAGALGMGQKVASGITTFNAFWLGLCLLLGAYITDSHLGRYNTMVIGILIVLVGHTLLIISAIPTMIIHPKSSLACFIVAIIMSAIGTGGFRVNIYPLIAEEAQKGQESHFIKTLSKQSEKVIVDPTLTTGRIYMYSYLLANIGRISGQIPVVYAEKYVGFWLAWLLTTLVCCLCPLVMILGRPLYHLRPRTGSIWGKALRLIKLGVITKFRASRNHAPQVGFWEAVKPSNLANQTPTWMNFNDEWVDQVKRGVEACRVFFWFPISGLPTSQLGNLISQAGAMKTHGLPNDIFINLEPLAYIILLPMIDMLVYPALRKAKINFSPIKRMTAGFLAGSMAMAWAAITQHWIYERSTCGNMAGHPHCPAVDLNVWIQTPSYILIALSQIFTVIAGHEYIFAVAPENMRSLVTALLLIQGAVSNAISEAFNPLSGDPLLVWNYGTMAVLIFVTTVAFYFFNKNLDQSYEESIRLKEGTVIIKEDYQDLVEPNEIEKVRNRNYNHRDA